MRKLFLLVVALLGVLVVGCENLFPTEQSPNATPIFETDSEGSYTVKADGKEITILVTTNIDYSVVIPTDAQEWLSAVCTRSDAREEMLAFVVAPNDSFEERSTRAELVDANGKVLESISFIQEGQSKVFRVDGNGNYVVTGLGGNVEVVVTTNLEYSVVIQKGAQSWLSVADTRADVRKETLTFIVAENEAYETRTATVELVGDDNQVLQKISIIQEEKVDTFIMTGENNYLVVAEGGEVNVVLITNLDYSVVIEKDAQAWLSVADTRALRVDELTFVVAPNTTYEKRTTTVELVDDKNKVLQEISFTQNAAAQSGSVCPNNEIWYTNGSTTEPTQPNATDVFGANIVSNTYDTDKECWVIKFDGDVTTIGSHAFWFCASLKSVIIPDSVTTIGDYAFYYCYTLASVTIGNSVTTIGDYAFSGCSSLTSVIIPDSVTTIGNRAFAYCSSLREFIGKYASEDRCCLIVNGTLNSFAIGCGATEYTIPDSVTTIGANAFFDCVSLTCVTIPNSVTDVKEQSFGSCNNLKEFKGKFAADGGRCLIVNGILNSFAIGCGATEYTIPNGVTTIGGDAFYYCTSLKSVVIPNSVTTINNSAFNLCTNLSSVYCQATTPPTGGLWMFDSNTSDRKIYVPAESVEAYKSAEYWSDYADAIVGYDFELGDVVVKMPNNEIWYTNGSITEPTEPNATDVFGANIVSNTYDAAKECWIITFDGKVTSIGDFAFCYCSSLTSVTIGNSVTTIGESAFYDCRSLTSVTIPDSVTTIGDGAFAYCSNLQEFNGKFVSEDGRCLIVDGTLNAFAPAGLTEYTIPDSVTTIGNTAFYGCRSLTSVTIPDSVTAIGDFAFSYCLGLAAFKGKFADDNGRILVINNFLVAFAPAAGDFKTYDIPEGITGLGNGAFYGCFSLNSVTIPKTVTTIGYATFGYCNYLKSVYCKATTPPIAIFDYQMMVWYAFRGDMNPYIYVPIQSVEAYKSAEGWDNYADAIVGYNF